MQPRETCISPVEAPAPRFSIAVPSSILGTEPSLREKTVKAGLVGRAASIFRVEHIHIYGRGSFSELRLLCKLLEYLETPPYLRKKLFRIDPDLRYAGILPPLQAPHHPDTPELRAGECREGVIVGKRGRRVLVDIGVGKPLELRGAEASLRRGDRITVKVMDPSDKAVLPAVPKGYWGYKVHMHENLRSLLSSHNYDLVIGTSRKGVPVEEEIHNLVERLRASERVLVIFGAPREGLPEIFKDEGIKPSIADIIANFIPRQGVRTVRTEEAIYIVLSILNLLASTEI